MIAIAAIMCIIGFLYGAHMMHFAYQHKYDPVYAVLVLYGLPCAALSLVGLVFVLLKWGGKL